MKNNVKIFLSLFVIVFLIIFVGTRNTDADVYSGGFEEKIYCNATIDDDFDGSSVLVVMDKNVGGINKIYEESFFGDFPQEYIKDLTELTVDIKEALIDEENFRQILQIKLSENSKENVLSVVRQLEKIEGIKYTGPNYAFYAGSTYPNDPGFVEQWGLTKINAPEAWDITQGSGSVKVGIIDTGIASHPDFSGNLVNGWSFNNSGTNDTNGHGTHVAGIVGAVGNNNIGISGISWYVSIVPLKFANNNNASIGNGGYSAEAILAINYAMNNGIPILNFSWWNYQNNTAFLNAINGYSGLFVCIAGNANININSGNGSPNYPGSWSSPDNRIITVGATNSDDTLWINPDINASPNEKGSNYGSTAVDLFAPGGINATNPTDAILTTSFREIGGQYWYVYQGTAGTSIAAPHVAGVAALIKAIRPGMNASTIKGFILDNVDVMPGLIGNCVTGGRLNAYSTLSAVINDASASFAGYNVTIQSHESGMYVNAVPPVGLLYANNGSPVTFTVSGMTSDGYVFIKFNNAYFSVVPNTDGGNGIYHPLIASLSAQEETRKFRIMSFPTGGYMIVPKLTGFPIFADPQMSYSIFTPSKAYIAGLGGAYWQYIALYQLAGLDINYYP